MGCGTEKPKKEEDRLAKLLIGSWRGELVFDAAAKRKELAKKGRSEAQIDLAIPALKKRYEKAEVLWTFTKNDLEMAFFNLDFGDRAVVAWKFISSTENTLKFKTIEFNGKEQEHELRFQGDDEFTVVLQSKRASRTPLTIRFKRAKVGPQKYKPRKR